MESTDPEQKPAEEEVFDEFEYKKKTEKQLATLKQQHEWAVESFDGDYDRTQKVKDEEKNWREMKSYKDEPPITWLQTFEMMMIILGEPEEKHLDWNAHLVLVHKHEDLIKRLTSYDYSNATKAIFETVKEKMQVMEGGFDARKQFNKKMPTAPIAQWVKEWYTAAESKVSSEDLAQQIKDLEEDMKIKLKL